MKEAEQANGPAPAPLQPGTPMRSIPRDADGFPQLPAGTPGQVGMGRNGNMYVSADCRPCRPLRSRSDFLSAQGT